MESQKTLTDMPEDVMELILGKCDFRSILCLRKVCHSIRNFIDDVEPDSSLQFISISNFTNGAMLQYTADSIVVALDFRKLENFEGTLLRVFRKEMIYEDENYWDVLYRELKMLLKFQKSTLKYFSFRGAMENFSKLELDSKINDIHFLLKNRKFLLKTEELCIDVKNQSQLMKILKFLDPETLRSIQICPTDPIPYGESKIFKIAEIKTLDQWRNAEELKIGRYVLEERFAAFSKFSKTDVTVTEVTVDEVMEMTKILLASPNFQNLKFRYQKFNGDRSILNRLGPVNISRARDYRWFVQMPNSMEVLELTLFSGSEKLEFSKIAFMDLSSRSRMS